MLTRADGDLAALLERYAEELRVRRYSASSLDKAHVALLLLLAILGGSATGGRAVGLLLAAASFLIFNWFFLPPYGTLIIANPLDWLVLVAFLVTGIVAAQLLYVAQEKARSAQERADEIDRLSSLGAETLSVAEFVEIAGAAHASFGDYGPQAGDGTPAIDGADMTAEITASVAELLPRL